jgi:hypothetical protein
LREAGLVAVSTILSGLICLHAPAGRRRSPPDTGEERVTAHESPSGGEQAHAGRAEPGGQS